MKLKQKRDLAKMPNPFVTFSTDYILKCNPARSYDFIYLAILFIKYVNVPLKQLKGHSIRVTLPSKSSLLCRIGTVSFI